MKKKLFKKKILSSFCFVVYIDVGDILCAQEEVIVVKGDRKINLFSNEEWEEE